MFYICIKDFDRTYTRRQAREIDNQLCSATLNFVKAC